MKYEYKTTYGSLREKFPNGDDYKPDDPEPPEGDGWEMCGMAASNYSLYWSWRRLT